MNRTTIDFGIDLGTTNSTVAVIDDIDAKVIPNKVGSGITPSAVWMDKRGNIHVGVEAKNRALCDDADNADLEFKLRMGLGPESKKRFLRSGRDLLPEELSAEVLKSLKMDVQSSMGEELRSAVITVPAAFENPQTNATQRAAQLAGLGRVPLLLEPVAASLAYGFQSESDNVYWFVYDFGGGTFDAAVMRIRDGLIQVVNHDGDNHLGGKLLDWDIVTKKLIPAITAQYNLPNFRRGGDPRWSLLLGNMKHKAEQAKIEVCRSKAPSEVWLEGLCQDADGKDVDFTYMLTPADVEDVSKPFIERSLSLCRKALKQTGLSGSNMERILMVGGSTLNPWVRDAVQSELGSRLEFGIDPVTVVARGAAIFASTQPMAGEPKPVKSGTWSIEIEHKPVGNVPDPDIGGRVVPPNGQNVDGFTVELVDTKTRWRSGRISLGADGVFMTQLFAEKQKRHEYAIELCDATGTRIPTSPDHVSYTLGVIPEENPPAAMSLGVGLANGGMAIYVKKGTRLPFRKSMDHYTTIPLRVGHAEDELRIPLLEGEHPRAERNHNIGYMTITGADLKRDLPVGSMVEITLIQDVSQQVRLQAYINTHNEDLEKSFDPLMSHNSLELLRKDMKEQKERFVAVQAKAKKSGGMKAEAALAQIGDQQILAQVESLNEAAETDPGAVQELDRRLRAFAAVLDEAEASVEWPTLLENAEKSREDAERVVKDFGEAGDRSRLRSLKEELQHAIDENDPDLLRRCTEELDVLYFAVMDRQPGYHVNRFNRLVERVSSMRDPGQAEQIIAQGRRAINNNDVDALKAANRQLISMLPKDDKDEAKHKNHGGTMTQE